MPKTKAIKIESESGAVFSLSKTRITQTKHSFGAWDGKFKHKLLRSELKSLLRGDVTYVYADEYNRELRHRGWRKRIFQVFLEGPRTLGCMTFNEDNWAKLLKWAGVKHA